MAAAPGNVVLVVTAPIINDKDGAAQVAFSPADVSVPNVLRAVRNWFEPHPLASARIAPAKASLAPPPTSYIETSTNGDDGAIGVVAAAISGTDFALPSGSVLCPNWMQLQHLTSLDIHDAPEFVFPALAISRFTQLTTLRLAGNGIVYALGLSDLPPLLEALDLSDNCFSGTLALSLLPRQLVEINLARNQFVAVPSSSSTSPSIDLDGLPATAVYVNLHAAIPPDVPFQLSATKGKPPALRRLFVGPVAHDAPASWTATDVSTLGCTDLVGGLHAKEIEPVAARSNLCVCLAHQTFVIGSEDGSLVMTLSLGGGMGAGVPTVEVAAMTPPNDASGHTRFRFTSEASNAGEYVVSAEHGGILYNIHRESSSSSGLRLMASTDWHGRKRALMPLDGVEGVLSSDGVLFSLFGKGRDQKLEVWSTATVGDEPKNFKTLPLSDVVAADVRWMVVVDGQPSDVVPYHLVAAVLLPTQGGPGSCVVGVFQPSTDKFVAFEPIALGPAVYGASVSIAANRDAIMVRYATDATTPAFLSSLKIISIAIDKADVGASKPKTVITIVEQIRHAALSADGSTLATASSLVKGLRTSLAETGYTPISGRARNDVPGFVACSANGKLVLSAPGDLDGAPRELRMYKTGAPDLVLVRTFSHDTLSTKTHPMCARFSDPRFSRIFSWGDGEPGRVNVASWNLDDGALINVITNEAKAILDVDAQGRVLSLFDDGGGKNGGVSIAREHIGGAVTPASWSFVWGRGERDGGVVESSDASCPPPRTAYISMGAKRDFLQLASTDQPTLWALYDHRGAPTTPEIFTPVVVPVPPDMKPKIEEKIEVAIM